MGGNVATSFSIRERNKKQFLSALTLIAVAPKGPIQIPISVARQLADRASHECPAGTGNVGKIN
jgi:hypothetical protein